MEKYKINFPKEREFYIIATKDIKRITLPSDELQLGQDATLSSEKGVKMPKYVVCELVKEGFLQELSTGMPIVHEKYKNDRLRCNGMYFTMEDENTGKKIVDDKDVAMCYDASKDPNYLRQVKQTIHDFFYKGMESIQIQMSQEKGMAKTKRYN